METIEFLQRMASPTLDRVMLFITDLGDEQAYVALLVIIYLGISPWLGRRVGVVLLASFFLNFHLKGIVDTARPFALDPAVARGEAAMATAPGAGFPSGHAQGAATFWGYLAVRVRRPSFWVLAGLVVGLISVSRVYLGVHVPLDIAGGLAIGVAVVAAALVVERFTPGLAQRWPVLCNQPLLFALGLAVPLALHLLLAVDDSALLMGGMAAFLTAPMLIRHQVPASPWRRMAVVAVGLALVFAALVGSSVALPEAVKSDAWAGFARYLLIGYVGLALTPYLVRRLRIGATAPTQSAASISGVTPVTAPPSTTNSVPVE